MHEDLPSDSDTEPNQRIPDSKLDQKANRTFELGKELIAWTKRNLHAEDKRDKTFSFDNSSACISRDVIGQVTLASANLLLAVSEKQLDWQEHLLNAELVSDLDFLTRQNGGLEREQKVESDGNSNGISISISHMDVEAAFIRMYEEEYLDGAALDNSARAASTRVILLGLSLLPPSISSRSDSWGVPLTSFLSWWDWEMGFEGDLNNGNNGINENQNQEGRGGGTTNSVKSHSPLFNYEEIHNFQDYGLDIADVMPSLSSHANAENRTKSHRQSHSTRRSKRNESIVRTEFNFEVMVLDMIHLLAYQTMVIFPKLSFVVYECLSVWIQDMHQMEHEPINLHLDLALYAAKSDNRDRLKYHCCCILKHPELIENRELELAHEILGLIVSQLCNYGQYEEALDIINDLLKRISGGVHDATAVPFAEVLNHSNVSSVNGKSSDGSNSDLSSHYFGVAYQRSPHASKLDDDRPHTLHGSPNHPGSGSKHTSIEEKAKRQDLCDQLYLRRAHIMFEFGLVYEGVHEAQALLRRLCERKVKNTAINGCKMGALSMLAKAYLNLDHVEACKKVLVGLKLVRSDIQVCDENKSKNKRRSSKNNTQSSISGLDKASVLASLGRKREIENLGSSFADFSEDVNYEHAYTIAKMCSSELHIDLGPYRAMVHLKAKEHALALKSLVATMLDLELTLKRLRYPPEGLRQLAELYLLRGEIQMDASKNTSQIEYVT